MFSRIIKVVFSLEELTASPGELLCLQMIALFVFSWVVDLLCIDIVPVILYRACINK